MKQSAPSRRAIATAVASLFFASSCGGVDVSRWLRLEGRLVTRSGSPVRVDSLSASWPTTLDGEAAAEDRATTQSAVTVDGQFTLSAGVIAGEFWLILPCIRPFEFLRSPLSPGGVRIVLPPGESTRVPVAFVIEPGGEEVFVVRRLSSDGLTAAGPDVGTCELVESSYGRMTYRCRVELDE